MQTAVRYHLMPRMIEDLPLLLPAASGVGVKMVMGVNSWQNTTQLTMVPASQVQQLQLQPPQHLLEAALQDWQQQMQQELAQRGTAESATSAAQSSSSSSSSGGGLAPALQSVLQRPAASCGVGEWDDGDWWVVQLPQLPADCYQVDAVFCDEFGAVYDNNDSNDYFMPVPQPDPWQPVQPPPPAAHQQQEGNDRISLPGRASGTVAATAAVVWSSEQLQFEDAGHANVILAAAAAAAAPAEAAAAAAASSSQVCFSMPAFPVAGAPMTVYVNRARLAHGLGQAPNLKLYIGFNGWEGTSQQVGFGTNARLFEVCSHVALSQYQLGPLHALKRLDCRGCTTMVSRGAGCAARFG